MKAVLISERFYSASLAVLSSFFKAYPHGIAAQCGCRDLKTIQSFRWIFTARIPRHLSHSTAMPWVIADPALWLQIPPFGLIVDLKRLIPELCLVPSHDVEMFVSSETSFKVYFNGWLSDRMFDLSCVCRRKDRFALV